MTALHRAVLRQNFGIYTRIPSDELSLNHWWENMQIYDRLVWDSRQIMSIMQ